MIATSYRYIVRRAGVRDGHTIVEDTRTGVQDVLAMVETGASVDEVAASFSKLTRAKVYECLAYLARGILVRSCRSFFKRIFKELNLKATIHAKQTWQLPEVPVPAARTPRRKPSTAVYLLTSSR